MNEIEKHDYEQEIHMVQTSEGDDDVLGHLLYILSLYVKEKGDTNMAKAIDMLADTHDKKRKK